MQNTNDFSTKENKIYIKGITLGDNENFRAYLTYKDNNIDFSPNNRNLTKLN